MKRVLVCGSRDFPIENGSVIRRSVFERLAFDENLTEYRDWTLVVGGAPGADLIAMNLAMEWRVPIDLFEANWKEFGRAAGPLRNQQMLDSGVDLGFAFVWNKELSESRGTKDMVSRLNEAGVPNVVTEVWP